MSSPTFQHSDNGSLNSALRRNIDALRERRRREFETAPAQERIAQFITNFTGSMRFVYIHVALSRSPTPSRRTWRK
jgi:uncharacterized membrane protein